MIKAIVQLNLAIVLTGIWSPCTSKGVTRHHFKPSSFVTQISELSPSLDLPLSVQVEPVTVPTETLRIRASRSAKDQRIEPLTITVPTNDEQLHNLAIDLARPGRSRQFATYLSRKLNSAGASAQESLRFKRVEIDEKGFRLIDARKLAQMLEQPHQALTLHGAKIRANTPLRQEFVNQLKPFLSRNEFARFQEQLQQGRNISVERDLLPSFARKMVRRFIAYRGPNCFHAALAFYGVELPHSPYINFKEEPGFHRAMINYDELWRAVQKNFYEIDPERTALKYGDMIIFFEVEDPDAPTYYRWVRHASTYLFGPYVFSKGSKSPNTPYTIKTLQEEWQIWQNMTKNLGVKIYRPSPKELMTRPPVDRLDWLY